MLVISARLAPFPPSRYFMSLLPSWKSYTYLSAMALPPTFCPRHHPSRFILLGEGSLLLLSHGPVRRGRVSRSARRRSGRRPRSFVDGVQEVVDLLRRPGGNQLVDLVGVGEDDRDPAQDVHVATLVAGDPEGEQDLVAVPVDRLGVADHRQRRPLDRLLGVVGAVRDGQVVAHVGGDRPLPLEHRVDVVGRDRADIDQHLAGLPDGVVLAPGRSRHPDLGQRQHVTHASELLCSVAGGRAQLGAPLPSVALVCCTSSTTASYLGLFMKFSTETCWALGVRSMARRVRSLWVTTRS